MYNRGAICQSWLILLSEVQKSQSPIAGSVFPVLASTLGNYACRRGIREPAPRLLTKGSGASRVVPSSSEGCYDSVERESWRPSPGITCGWDRVEDRSSCGIFFSIQPTAFFRCNPQTFRYRSDTALLNVPKCDYGMLWEIAGVGTGLKALADALRYCDRHNSTADRRSSLPS